MPEGALDKVATMLDLSGYGAEVVTVRAASEALREARAFVLTSRADVVEGHMQRGGPDDGKVTDRAGRAWLREHDVLLAKIDAGLGEKG